MFSTYRFPNLIAKIAHTQRAAHSTTNPPHPCLLHVHDLGRRHSHSVLLMLLPYVVEVNRNKPQPNALSPARQVCKAVNACKTSDLLGDWTKLVITLHIVLLRQG